MLAIAAGASLERSLPDPAGPVAPPMPGRPPAHVDPKQPPVPPRPHLGRVNQPSPEPELFPVAVTTQPAGATVSANGNHCTAPCQLDLPPGSHLVTAELNGFRLAQQLVRVPKQLEAVIPLDRLDAEGPR
ncbi:MAG: PEGA domain-containing protein [Acidobacteria bacterium]|nr:PEGA domain-containing protein [Acidobacteriota bacterium]